MFTTTRHRSRKTLANRFVKAIGYFALPLTLSSFTAFHITGSANAAPQVSVSAGLSATESAIRDHPRDLPLALFVDTPSISAIETESLLHALEDRRREGGLTVAIVGPVGDGASLVALSCDAMVSLPNARLSGADEQWCTSPSRRDGLVVSVQRLGRVTEPLARRLVETKGAISWEKTGGFQASDAGSLLLAQDGAMLELSSAQLEQTGLSARGYKDLAAASAAIDSRLVRARAASTSTVIGAGGATPRGRPPLPSPNPPSTPTGSAPSTPATPSSPPASGGVPVDMAKLSPKLKEYQTQLSELKSKLAEFDRYYRGVAGVWTTQHKSLKAVWESKTEMTKDKDTKLRCSRLQQDIREIVTRIESITRSIEKICDDKKHADVVRTAAGLETLKQFREAIQRNEVDDYDRYKPLAERLN